MSNRQWCPNERDPGGCRGPLRARLRNVLWSRPNRTREPRDGFASELYPLIYFKFLRQMPRRCRRLLFASSTHLLWWRLVIDTRRAERRDDTDLRRWKTLLEGSTPPRLHRLPDQSLSLPGSSLDRRFPAAFANRRLWIERPADRMPARAMDVSRLFIGVRTGPLPGRDSRGRDLYSVEWRPTQAKWRGAFRQ